MSQICTVVVCIMWFQAAAPLTLMLVLGDQIFMNPYWVKDSCCPFQTASTTNRVSKLCHFSAHHPFLPLFIPLIFSPFYTFKHKRVCPILTEAGSSENVSDSSTDTMIHSVTVSKKHLELFS